MAMKRNYLWVLLATACSSEQVGLEDPPAAADETADYFYLSTLGEVEGEDPIGLEGSTRQPLIRVRLSGDRDALIVSDHQGNVLARFGGAQLERFSVDRIEAVETEQTLSLDYDDCYRRAGWFVPLEKCVPIHTSVRHSFLRVAPDRNYLPKPASESFGFYRSDSGHRVQRASRAPAYYLAPDVLPHEAELARTAAAAFGIEVRDNDCRPENIRNYRELGEVASTELAAICVELERSTNGAFTWQRPGSLAANTISFLRKPGPWGTYAPLAVDQSTGEIVAGSIFIRAATFESAAARAAAGLEADRDTDFPFDTARAFRFADERRDQHLAELASDAFMDRVAARLAAPAELRPLKSASSLALVSVPTSSARTVIDVYAGTGAYDDDPSELDPHVRDLLYPQGWSSLSIARNPLRAENLASITRDGYAFLRDDRDPHYERLAASNELEVLPQLLQHAMSKSFAMSLGLAPNYAGSFDVRAGLFASVLDVFPAEDQVAMIGPGEYELAALAFAFSPDELVDPSNYLYCSADQAYRNPTTRCQSGDQGTSPIEVFANYERRWDGDYRFYTFDIGRFRQPFELPERIFDPAHAPLAYAMTAANELTERTNADPSFIETEEARELVTVAAQGLNFAIRVLRTPDFDRYCEFSDVLLPYYYHNECDRYADINAPESRAVGMVDIFAGEGRGTISPIADFDEYRTPAQYRHDRLAVLWMLEPAFAELFAPELRELLRQMVTGDHFLIHTVQENAPHWCGDRLEPPRLIDPVTGARPTALPASCTDAPAVFVSDFVELEYLAPFYVHAQLGSFIVELEIFINGEVTGPDFCEVTDDLNQTYVAMRSRNPLACALIDRAAESLTDAAGNPSNPMYRERSRDFLARVRHLHELTNLR